MANPRQNWQNPHLTSVRKGADFAQVFLAEIFGTERPSCEPTLIGPWVQVSVMEAGVPNYWAGVAVLHTLRFFAHGKK